MLLANLHPFAIPVSQVTFCIMEVVFRVVLLAIMDSTVNAWFAAQPFFASHVPIAMPARPVLQATFSITRNAILLVLPISAIPTLSIALVMLVQQTVQIVKEIVRV